MYDGVLPRASRDEDEFVPARVEGHGAVHDGLQFAAGTGLWIDHAASPVSIGDGRKVADARRGTGEFCCDDSFGFCRVLPSSV
jgi:hypothetical protein